jgi:hypothetical protein
MKHSARRRTRNRNAAEAQRQRIGAAVAALTPTAAISPVIAPAEVLARQQADFTAEGSPPPGKVASAGPVLTSDAAIAPVPTPDPPAVPRDASRDASRGARAPGP